MKTCILCGKLTEGSVGAAGIRWDIICQPCKDIEDGILRRRIMGFGKAMDTIFQPVEKERT